VEDSFVKIKRSTKTAVEGIALDQQVSDQILRHGKTYYEEARRILTNIPRFPSKYQQATGQGNNLIVFGSREKRRVSSEILMKELESYINGIIQFSPLICNLIYLRDFLINRPDGASAADLNSEHQGVDEDVFPSDVFDEYNHTLTDMYMQIGLKGALEPDAGL